MTGIRSWTDEVTAFGVVVKIEQVLIQLPLAFFQRSQIPAKANKSPLQCADSLPELALCAEIPHD
jgi:hypothetical protein